MARGLRALGAQRLKVFNLEAEAAEEELEVLREARVTAREDEAISAEPVRILGIVVHDVLVQEVGSRGEAHSRARVPIADLLYGIRGEDPRVVDGTLVEIAPALGGYEIATHESSFPSIG